MMAFALACESKPMADMAGTAIHAFRKQNAGVAAQVPAL
jgi:hypothetical protein